MTNLQRLSPIKTQESPSSIHSQPIINITPPSQTKESVKSLNESTSHLRWNPN